MVAEVLGLPALTHARQVTVEGAVVTVRRETDDGVVTLTAELPAVVSVGEKINEPRNPSFKRFPCTIIRWRVRASWGRRR